MAFSIGEANKGPDARQRIMNWAWDGWPARKPWWAVHAIARVTCRIWGHQPVPGLCGWCLKAQKGGGPA